MNVAPVNIIQLLLSAQSFFFVAFLLTQKKGKRLSNALLASFLGVLGLHMLFNLGFETEQLDFPFNPTHSFGFLYGPLFYLYVSSLAYQSFRLTPVHALHGVPWLLVLLVSVLLTDFDTRISGVAITVSLAGYLGFTYRSIGHYQHILRQTQARYDTIALKWAKDFLLYLGIIAVLDLLHSILTYQAEWIAWAFYVLLTGSLLLLVNTLVFRGLKHPELFGGLSDADASIAKAAHDKYASSTLTTHQIENYQQQIREYFDTHEPFLNPDLSLQTLADDMQVPARDLSQVINGQFEQNFSEFVNTYRVRKAQQLFEEDMDRQKTVLEIVYAVGFNSKSSFYTAFKKHTHLTPSQFRQRIHQNT